MDWFKDLKSQIDIEPSAQERMFEILNMTKNHYSSENLGKNAKGKPCYFSRDTETLCAIGMLLNEEDLFYIVGNKLNNSPINEIIMHCAERGHSLTSDIFELPNIFLVEIQAFHDKSSLWGKNGLNDAGKEKFNRIKQLISNNTYENVG